MRHKSFVMRNIKEKIQGCGLKATPQRLAIYDSMCKLGHASADMVVEMLKEIFPSITVATVYNVLESFVEAGLLTRRLSMNHKMYFDVNVYEHAHLYDTDSNIYTDYDDQDLNRIVWAHVKEHMPRNFRLKNIDIQLIGTTQQ